jgi:periplasmic protein TonB
MFEDSLLESGNKIKTKSLGWTLFMFLMESLFVVVLILIPLIYTEALPKGQLATFLVAPPPPPPPPPPPAAPIKVVKVQSEMVNNTLRTPTKIPEKVKIIQEEEQPPQMASGVMGGVPGGVPGGSMGGVIGGIIGTSTAAVPKVAITRTRVSSGVISGLLIKRVEPTYPALAKTARVQGTVVLHAIISKEGNIQGLTLVSGPAMLAPSAIDAVKQWRYKPYLLNGDAIEVDTTVEVTFRLGG